jgi:hypothetical protein
MVDSLKVLDPNRPIREAEVAGLFDHLVSAGEQDRRNRDVGLRRVEIINRWNGISGRSRNGSKG